MAEEKMVTVNLRRSIGVRTPGTRGAAKLYGPGEVKIPASLARSIGAKQVRGATAEAADTTPDPYKEFLKDDYVAEAERRELAVARGDGKDGDPRVEDYRAALLADDAAKA